jgi:hypothetical protein
MGSCSEPGGGVISAAREKEQALSNNAKRNRVKLDSFITNRLGVE